MHAPHRRLLALTFAFLVPACASSDEAPPAQPTPAPGDTSQDQFKSDIERIRAGQPVAGAEAPAQDTAALLQQSREHQTLVDQRVAALVQAFLDKGLADMQAGDLRSAHDNFANAYELDPEDPAARQLYQTTAAQLGLPGGELGAVVSAARDRAAARVDQARLMVQHEVNAGDDALASNDPDAALRHYEDAMLMLKANPDVGDMSLGEADVARRLAVARRAAQDAAGLRDAELLRRAETQQMEFDKAEAGQNDRRVQALKDSANSAFLADEYVAAEQALDEVLKIDPDDAEALELQRIVRKARHGARDRSTRLAYRTAWQDTFDELDQEAVIPNDLIVFPDADAWKVIEDRGNKSFGSGGSTDESALDTAVRQRLEKSIPVSFQDEPLDAILVHLQAVTGANFIMTQAARDAEVPPITLEDKASQPVSRILTIITEDLSIPPLTWTVQDGVVRVQTAEETRNDYELEMYDIRDLTFTPKDYPAQDFNLLPSGTDKESYQAEAEEESVPFIGADALMELIQNNIATESWTSDPNRTIQLMPGTLVVRQTPDVHEQIRQLLDDLRLNTKSLVHIETRFVEVEDSFLEDIGVDLRGLDGSLTGGFPLEDFGQSGAGGFGTPQSPTGIGTGNDPGFFYSGNNGDLKGRIENLFDSTLGEPNGLAGGGGLSMQALFLDDTNVQAVLRAVTKYSTSNVVNAPSLTLRSGQRGNVKQLTTRTYVRDFEPEIAQAAVIAQPELDNVKDGVILDVRAVASADRRFVTLELRPTIIQLIPDQNGNPLPQETVSLATQNSSDVTIELPELRIQRLRTTATIPDGATLMLGGLKKSVEQNQTSSVPFLGDIPILGSLFSRTGEYTSKRKLIILLKASILNPEEHEPDVGAKR